MSDLAGERLARDEWRGHWKIPIVAALGNAASMTAIYSLGALMPAIQAATGWSRSEVSSGPTFLTVGAILFGPVLGAMIDRIGSRRIALVGLTIFCAALGGLGFVSNQIASWWIGWSFVAIGYVAIKPTVWTAAVIRCFDKGRGLALGVALSGIGIGSSLSPITATLLEVELGWRATYMCFAVGLAVLTVPWVWLFFIDTAAPAHRGSAAASVPSRKGTATTRLQIVRSGRYLLMALACLLSSVPAAALIVDRRAKGTLLAG